MASNKTGFPFYSIDTDRYQDIRIKKLRKDYGCAGIAVYDYILCEIYRVKGCFLEWDESTAFDVSDYFGLKENVVNEIVNYCLAVGLFDKELLMSGSVLSSQSIQKRYTDMCIRAKRKLIIIPDEYNILPEEYQIILEGYNKIPVKCRIVKYSKVNNNPPNSPPLQEDEVEVVKTWRDDFGIYLSGLNEAYNALLNDPVFIAERQRYHPNLDICLSMEKAYKDYWSTEVAWKKRKRSKTKELDWKATFRNSLDQKFNHVYQNKSNKNESETVHFIS